MGSTQPHSLRTRQMLEMIRMGTRTGQYPNRTDFCRELEISPRTAMRDLDALRDRDQAPVAYDASRKGFYLWDLTWSLPAIRLSRRHLFAFSIARKVLAAYRGTPLETEIEATMARIAEQVDGEVTLDWSTLSDGFLILGEDYARVDPEHWLALARAVEYRERVRVLYRRSDGAKREYPLEPVHLVAYHGDWYVLARRAEQEPFKTYAISRVDGVWTQGEYFEVPEEFDARRHFASAFGIVRGEKPFRVRLLFSASVATYIESREWHPTQRCTRRPDGRLELTLETGGRHELVRWILSWQPDVKVVSPKRLRQRVEEKLRRGLEPG